MKILFCYNNKIEPDVGLSLGQLSIISYINKYISNIVIDIKSIYDDINIIEYDCILFSFFLVFSGANETSLDFIKKCKKEFPNIPILVGGYFGLQTELICLVSKYADAVCFVEGEEICLQFVKAVKSNELQNFLNKNSKNSVIHYLDYDFDKLPVVKNPYYKLKTDPGVYMFETINSKKTIFIEIVRGCPNGCSYCPSRIMFPKVKFHSFEYLKNIVDNIESEQVVIQDICPFKSNIDIYIKFIEYCLSLNKRIIFQYDALYFFINDEKISNLILKTFPEYGISEYQISVDCPSKRIAKMVNRDEYIFEKIIKTLELLISKKILINSSKVILNFLMGFPGEILDDAKEMFEYINTLKKLFNNKVILQIGIYRLFVYEGSPLKKSLEYYRSIY